jgi:hypothetical protein
VTSRHGARVRTAVLGLGLSCALAASAYIPSAASLVRRAAARVGEGSRSKEASLNGWLWVGEQQAQQATLTLHFPLGCKLEAGKAAVQVVSKEQGGSARDDGLGAEALDLLKLACPLVAYRGQNAAQAEQSLRFAALVAGVAPELAPTALARLYDRVAIVLGAGARQLDRPQLWLYKDNGAPARLLAKVGDRLDDLRLLQYGNPAAGEWFPRVIELWRGPTMVARFEALGAHGFIDNGPAADDEAAQ